MDTSDVPSSPNWAFPGRHDSDEGPCPLYRQAVFHVSTRAVTTVLMPPKSIYAHPMLRVWTSRSTASVLALMVFCKWERDIAPGVNDQMKVMFCAKLGYTNNQKPKVRCWTPLAVPLEVLVL